MRLRRARVQKYRSIRDTGWFDVEGEKTIFVGPNEAGKTALLRALQQLNAPPAVAGFDQLRDYPRSELNDLDSGRILAADITVVQAEFELDPADQAVVSEVDPAFIGCTYVAGRRLDNSFWHDLEGGPKHAKYGSLRKEFVRLAAHVDQRVAQQSAASSEQADAAKPASSDAPSVKLSALVEGWSDATEVDAECAQKLRLWLDNAALPYVDQANSAEEKRYDTLAEICSAAMNRQRVLSALEPRLPTFVYYSNYFRVRPRIHLGHLAKRVDQKLLDDEQYDFGNLCLLKLLGFTPRELSDLGKAAEPAEADAPALRKYEDQLDKRDFKLNAASVHLTGQIREAWQPDAKHGEASTLRVKADQQYLKVVVEDDLGVEVELDQRSEGFQWLVSFFVVFFAQVADKHSNAILLLDEPGLSLHGLKQREFRTTISRLAKDNQALFTTHSPFLVGPDELDMVRVVEMPDRKRGTQVHTTVTADSPAALLPLQEALGYDLAQSLFAQQRNLILEGLTDMWYLESTAALLRESGDADLNETVSLIPAHSAGKVVYFATILHAHSLKVAALLDSDTAGDEAAKQDVLVHTLKNKRILRTKDAYSGPVNRPEVEDMLRDTLVSVAKSELGWDVSAKAATQPSRPIVDLFAAEFPDFSKYRLAKAYVRWTRSHSAGDLSLLERQHWKSLVEAINKALK